MTALIDILARIGRRWDENRCGRAASGIQAARAKGRAMKETGESKQEREKEK